MKKTIILLATASALIAATASCKKEHMPKEAVVQTVNVSIKANESFTFELPKNLRDDPFEITSQAAHFSVSELGVNAAGNRIFSYTPSKDFTGTDKVILSNDQEREQHQHPGGPPQNGCSQQGPPPAGGPQGPPPSGGHQCGGHHHKGNCNKGEEDHYIITINFVVESSQTTPAAK